MVSSYPQSWNVSTSTVRLKNGHIRKNLAKTGHIRKNLAKHRTPEIQLGMQKKKKVQYEKRRNSGWWINVTELAIPLSWIMPTVLKQFTFIKERIAGKKKDANNSSLSPLPPHPCLIKREPYRAKDSDNLTYMQQCHACKGFSHNEYNMNFRQSNITVYCYLQKKIWSDPELIFLWLKDIANSKDKPPAPETKSNPNRNIKLNRMMNHIPWSIWFSHGWQDFSVKWKTVLLTDKVWKL